MISILYVDDEPALLELGKLFLERSGQFKVDTITSALAALTLLNSKTYDAIISDYQMPEIDGIEFLKLVRESRNSIPFIILTGRGREEVVIQALKEGVDFYLQKGGDPQVQYTELSNTIHYAVMRKRAEEALKLEKEEFVKKNKELNASYERISATEEALRQANRKLNLLSGITRHDINNQLTVLMGYLAILEEGQNEPLHDEYLQKASTAAERIHAMIQFTREYESIGVNAPVWQNCRTSIDTAAEQIPHGNIIVKNDFPEGMEVFADLLIVKVFYNLMDNAVRYGEKTTTIRFSAQESGDDYLIICEDDGVGIPVKVKEQIFSHGFGKNTGLGLFLTREILTLTGITIRETGKPGKGARFEILVPKGAYRFESRPDIGCGSGIREKAPSPETISPLKIPKGNEHSITGNDFLNNIRRRRLYRTCRRTK
jgi:signal transduction histidine kinase